MNRRELIGKTSRTPVSEDGESIQEAEEKGLAGRIAPVKTRRLSGNPEQGVRPSRPCYLSGAGG